MELQLYGSIPRLPFATLIPRSSPGLTFFHWQNTGAAIQVISTHRKSSPSQSRITHLNVFNTAVVLTMRLYAMWKNNKYIVALLISLIAVESTVIGVVFGMTTKTVGSSSLLLPHVLRSIAIYSATNNPAQGVFICADGDKPGRPWATFYYTSILVTELAFLGLSLLRAWYDHGFGTGGRLMRILTRDSVYYFAV